MQPKAIACLANICSHNNRVWLLIYKIYSDKSSRVPIMIEDHYKYTTKEE